MINYCCRDEGRRRVSSRFWPGAPSPYPVSIGAGGEWVQRTSCALHSSFGAAGICRLSDSHPSGPCQWHRSLRLLHLSKHSCLRAAGACGFLPRKVLTLFTFVFFPYLALLKLIFNIMNPCLLSSLFLALDTCWV